MIGLTQIKLPIDHTEEDLYKEVLSALSVSRGSIESLTIRKKSIDARKKPALYFVYSLDVTLVPGLEKKILKKNKKKNVQKTEQRRYRMPAFIAGDPGRKRPVVVGSGPAGLFCAWLLAKAGLCPLVLERGEDVDHRSMTVAKFWESGLLNSQSNVQFGEGGAGTFSDGKLNTSVSDPKGRNYQVLSMLVEAGAPAKILYEQKPHLGTDQLLFIVKNIRRQIEAMGGEFSFSSCVTDLILDHTEGGAKIKGLQVNKESSIDADTVVLAIGHSARDTFSMLYEKGVSMIPKAFAVGLRMEHPQEMIDLSQYGQRSGGTLEAASYKLTSQTRSGRGVYSFCMCPGGWVVNASSEAGHLAVNGMSYAARDGHNANSAIIVTIGPEDFKAYGGSNVPDPLQGIHFQGHLEKAAFALAGGKVPVQTLDDFAGNRVSKSLGQIEPSIKGAWDFANLRQILPDYVSQAILEAMSDFGRKIKGFDRGDAVFSGVESRTSSPLRILRDRNFQSTVRGLYPCGEGAGYAGGITSAAMDGLKTAEIIAAAYQM